MEDKLKELRRTIYLIDTSKGDKLDKESKIKAIEIVDELLKAHSN